jgi:hypothetical protein
LIYEIIRAKAVLQFQLTGAGVGVKKGGNIQSSVMPELPDYPGETSEEREISKQSESFKPLRYTHLHMQHLSNTLKIEVTSYTDPVVSNFSKKVPEIDALRKALDASLTDNQLLSAFRAFNTAEQFVKELWRTAYFNFGGKEQSSLMNEMNTALLNSSCSLGFQTLSYRQYAQIVHGKENYFEKCLKDLKLEEEEIKKILAN